MALRASGVSFSGGLGFCRRGSKGSLFFTREVICDGFGADVVFFGNASP